MKSIDFKSLLIGILGTALVLVLMGQSSVQKQYDVECFSYIDPKVVMDPKSFPEFSLTLKMIFSFSSFLEISKATCLF